MVSEVARALRKRPTVAERLLWGQLRQLRSQGYHFRRQAPLHGFIVEFACLAQRLLIEVDGVQHDFAQNRADDSVRDADLIWRGFRVLRFSNADVMRNTDGVMLEVLSALGKVQGQD